VWGVEFRPSHCAGDAGQFFLCRVGGVVVLEPGLSGVADSLLPAVPREGRLTSLIRVLWTAPTDGRFFN
jgi:hypothetical protein